MPFLVYAIALVIAAGTLAFSVNLATAPDPGASQPRIAANSPVRQIPLGKPSDVSRGDPHNQLTPVYPAAPGKDLPPPAQTADNAADNKPSDAAQPNDAAKNVAVTQPAPPADASTTGVASSDTKIDQPRVDVRTAAPNSCAIDVCSSAYRSFRASDCTYQPYGGPRKVCELTAGGVQNASVTPQSPVPPQPREVAPRSRVSDFDAAARVVRQLPRPNDYENPGERRVIVIERPPARYAPRIIYEEW